MKRCKGCFGETDSTKLDLDGYCFTCASGWPTATEMRENIRQAMAETVKTLVARDGEINREQGTN